MRKILLITAAAAFLLAAGSARAQKVDVAFGLSTLLAPSASSASAGYTPQSLRGGAYPAFSGDFLFKHNFGVSGEVSWRAHQNSYLGIQPFRPVLFDFNGIWAPQLEHRISPEVMAGIGAMSDRFYQPYYVCGAFSGCTNYTSSTHFMGHIGGGIKLYVWGNVFVRPEAHLYLIHNNFDFSGPHAERVGLSIGYTWRASQ